MIYYFTVSWRHSATDVFIFSNNVFSSFLLCIILQNPVEFIYKRTGLLKLSYKLNSFFSQRIFVELCNQAKCFSGFSFQINRKICTISLSNFAWPLVSLEMNVDIRLWRWNIPDLEKNIDKSKLWSRYLSPNLLSTSVAVPNWSCWKSKKQR